MVQESMKFKTDLMEVSEGRKLVVNWQLHGLEW